MIKSISIKNFESHEDTTIHFSSGLNLLVGESNSGKSSIIRSAAAVVNNQWTKEMVRNGCSSCKVKMETERGWVECERGEKINVWKCFDGKSVQEYKKIGINVPEQVTEILGMGERDRGDIKELPNFMFQLEKHYMLSEVDGKKATSNLVARMMDNAIGLGGMEDFIKDISSDLLKDKKWLTEKTNEITELKSNILDEMIFKDYENLVKKITDSNNAFEENNDILKGAEDKYNQYQYQKKELDKLCNKKDISEEIENLYQLVNDINRLNNLVFLLNKEEDLQKRIDKLSEISSWEDIDNLIEDIRINAEKIEKASSILNDARKKWKKIKELDNIINAESKKSDILVKEFESLKKEIGICPICGAKL